MQHIPTLGSISLLNNGFKYNGSGPIDAARICSLCDAYNAFLSPECYEALGVVIDVLAAVGVIRSHHFWLDVEHIEEAIQNVLICLEMVVFSVLQQYAYHVAPYSGDVESKMKLNKKRE
ncbi:Protein of unknown function D [Prunus dulcis]|uniref:Uncharacterized protein n=1 Tax=Prunus dulcis TaxID=3755 RepID=A0A4Y1R9G5_PRUDU|nr:Protein of unknown function D [Prunus dulcis]